MCQKNPKKQIKSQSSRFRKIRHFNKKRKKRNQQTPETKRVYRKRKYQEKRNFHKKISKGKYLKCQNEKKWYKFKKIHHQIKQGRKWWEKYLDDGRSISRNVSLNLPVRNVITASYYKQWTDRRKYFNIKTCSFISAQYDTKACIKKSPDHLSMENMFSLQNRIILVKLFYEKVLIYDETSHNSLNKNKSTIK